MSSISDLAGYGSPVIMPEDIGHEGVKAKNPSNLFTVAETDNSGIPVKKLDVNSYANQSIKPLIAGGQSLTDASQHTPVDHSNKKIQQPLDQGDSDIFGQRLQKLNQTLAKYNFSSDPGLALKITNAILGANIGNKELIKLLPPDMSSDDMQAVLGFVDVIAGESGKTNYATLKLMLNPAAKLVKGKGVGSQILGAGINAAAKVIGNDAIKQEFEKSRVPIALPNHKDTEMLQYTWNLESSPKSQLMGDSFRPTKDKWYSKAAAAIANIGEKAILNALVPGFYNSGYPAVGVVNSSLRGGPWDTPMLGDSIGPNFNSVSGPEESDYLHYNDPINGVEEDCSSIYDYLNKLNNNKLLTGYKDYAGFEIGSNHDWMIKIYPYPHDQKDVITFRDLKRFTCVPPLPYYGLPNMWSTVEDVSDIRLAGRKPSTGSKNKKWSPFKSGKSTFSKIAASVGNAVANSVKNWATDKYNALVMGDTKNDISANQLYTDEYEIKGRVNREGVHYVSFGEYCPALSYDLNMGSPRTEDVKLFNGSSMQVMHGMQYNMTLNVSILDDVYHSMQKYMNQYYNCVYDLSESSMAPYYACAFDIRLYIFRSGKQINHALKLIGIPIDYPVKHSGSQDPDEARVDITFSIIGAGEVPRTKVYGNSSRLTNTDSIAEDSYGCTNSTNSTSRLLWDDVIVRARGNMK